MRVVDTRQLWEPFAEPVTQSQQAFRKIMKAMAEPGTLVNLSETYRQGRKSNTAKMPPSGFESAFVIALSLLDQDTSVWVSPTLANPVFLDNLRFHCGSRITTIQQDADFAFVTLLELTDFSVFKSGSEEHPQAFATIIALVRELSVNTADNPGAALSAMATLRLTGPGIQHERFVGIADFSRAHASLLTLNQQQFPLGYDLLLASGDSLVGLPRSTRTERLDGFQNLHGGQLCMSR